MKLIDLIPDGWPEKKKVQCSCVDCFTPDPEDVMCVCGARDDTVWNDCIASLDPIKNVEIEVDKKIVYDIICEYIFELHADNFYNAVDVIAGSLDKILVVKKETNARPN